VEFLCKAILFDLDGVLVDSTQAVERVWRKWAIEKGLDPSYVVDQAHGRRSIETVRAVAPDLDADQENLTIEALEIDDREGVTSIPGAAALLAQIPPEHIAIVTSATRALAVARLQYAALPIPKHLISSDDVVEGKPSPEPYLKGAALLHFAAKDCLVFEDTPAGIQAGKGAGAKAIALTTTYARKELQMADEILPSLSAVRLSFLGGELLIQTG